MTDVPAGAQVSEDGNYWWDGAAWQPVRGGAADPAVAGGGAAAAGAPPESLGGPSEGPMTIAWGATSVEQVDVPPMQDEGEATA